VPGPTTRLEEKGAVRVGERPKSREETPKEGSGATQQRLTAHDDNGAVQKKMQVRRNVKCRKVHALAFGQLCATERIDKK